MIVLPAPRRHLVLRSAALLAAASIAGCASSGYDPSTGSSAWSLKAQAFFYY